MSRRIKKQETAPKAQPAARKPESQNRTMVIMAYVALAGYALVRLLDILLIHTQKFGTEGLPSYSILASEKIYIAYQIWCIVLSGVTMYAIWKKNRILIYAGVLLLLILMFYPWFTQF